VERALDVAEALRLPGALANALITKAVTYYTFRGRREEALALLTHVREFALADGLVSEALRASFNLAEFYAYTGRLSESLEEIETALRHARERGDRPWENNLLLNSLLPLRWLGRWDELAHTQAQLATQRLASGFYVMVSASGVAVDCGRSEELEHLLEEMPSRPVVVDDEVVFGVVRTRVARAQGAEGASRIALEALRTAVKTRGTILIEAYFEAGDSALAAGNVDALLEAVETVEALPPGAGSPLLAASTARFRANLASRAGDAATASDTFRQAAALHREFDLPFGLAQVLLEHAEHLEASGTPAEAMPLREEAAEIFGRLGAEPWLRRAQQPSSRALSLNVD
jgi:tetratricopeptide (TPR) repeat protein